MRPLLLLITLLLLGLNTPAGFRALEAAAGLAGVTVTGLDGRFPDRLTADSLTAGDITVQDLRLDWRPSALLRGTIAVETLQATAVTVARWPASGSGGGGGPVALPPISLRHLQIDRLTLPEATLSLAGSLDFNGQSGTLADGTAQATLTGLRPDLLGAGPVTLDARLGPDLALDLHSDAAQLSLRGPLPGATIATEWRLTLPDLTRFAPSLTGTATAAGHIAGTPDDLTAITTVTAQLATGPIAGTITLRGLPEAPVAAVTGSGSWNGTAVTLDAGAARAPDGVIHVALSSARALGLEAQAALAIDPASAWPTGTVLLQADRLPGTGGSLDASIDLAAPASATVTAEAKGLARSGLALAAARLAATLTDALGTPTLKAQLDAASLRAGAFTETLRLTAEGPLAALALRLGATGSAAVQAAGLLDTAASRLTLASLQASAAGQTLRLQSPARLDYAAGLAIDRLRLGLGPASLDIAGRVAPALDLTASLRALPLSLASLFDPALDLHGTLQADATLHGRQDRPSGSLRLAATGVRAATARMLPPASLTATATLDGAQARIDARADAGPTQLTLTGTAPLGAGPYTLHASGHASLALLDPLLAAAGQQARGQLTLDASLTGTTPTLSGQASLTGGSFVDAAQGLRLSDITAHAHADDRAFVLDSLSARASGPITATARLDRTGDQALTASLTARDIAPLTSDALSVRLSADLTAHGTLATGLSAGGTIRLARAEIRIPDRLPASLPTLTLRKDRATAPPPSPPWPIALDITLTAPGQVFLRGRGIDAELGGRVHLGGTAADPRPEGGFTLRRGQVALAGQTLTFSAGRVGLDGHLPIDPTLDFTARAQGTGVIATLAVTGTASHPRIALSAVPDLPQDEVLAQLLFHQSAASLGPLQIAQIATGLAQLTDLGGAAAFDPVGSLRQRLGLDTLSVGGQAGGPTTVEGGRSIAKGVTLGARQSVGGVGTQATVRIDLARGLRLEADVGVAPPVPSTVTQGAAPTGNQVGVTYEFDY